jgi:hypothetical protein
MKDLTAAGGQVGVRGQRYHLSHADGQVRLHLSFRIDVRGLTRHLVTEGYPLAYAADEVNETQGWGPEYDPQAYYRWYVYPDPGRPGTHCFAFNPRPGDLVEQGASVRPVLTDESLRDVERWVPVLERFAAPDPVH